MVTSRPRSRAERIDELASRLSKEDAARHRSDFREKGLDGQALAVAVLLSTAFPPSASHLRREPGLATDLVKQGYGRPRDAAALTAAIHGELSRSSDLEGAMKALRRFARNERLRVSLRELLPRTLGGADVDVTSGELATLAEVTIHAALDEATRWGEARMGTPRAASGQRSTFVVLGMGKLGGGELNPGSDVDLIYFYDSDDGEARLDEESTSLHEFWTRVARRLTRTLEEVTEDGFVWRVDLRLRPEGGAGPIVNSLAAAERYYESFGRSWERAALLRARPVGGDLSLGHRLLESLSPFVWRKRIDPTIANEMASLTARSRAELSDDPERDLKLGSGGIREAEFFVQTLQLVWGGKEASLRAAGTLVALSRLEARGFATPKEATEIEGAYLTLRRAEHAVQAMSGVQTHTLPTGADLDRLSRMLGFPTQAAFLLDLNGHRERVASRFASLLPAVDGAADPRFAACLAALDRGDPAAFQAVVGKESGLGETDDALRLADNLFALARRPDGLLGSRTRDSFPGLAERLLDAVFEAADPAQAARYLRVFFDRVRQPAVYVRLVFSDAAALGRLTSVLGASAFVGDALSNNPELGDMILFSRGAVTTEAARNEVMAAETAAVHPDEDPDEALVGALRLAKTRLTLEVALGFLEGTLTLRQVTDVLSEVADASLEVATRRALSRGDRDASDRPVVGLSVIAMGKLGGQEISFGSDLDVLFLYDPSAAPEGSDPTQYFTRCARKVIALITSLHGAGPGYELDMRLRPSGNQGLLVTSLEAFARYHGFASTEPNAPRTGSTPVWERMALTRARSAAGDVVLGARAVDLAHRAAFEGTYQPEAEQELHRIRLRVENESSLERRGAHDLKLGRGGLLDIEFVVQLLQIRAATAMGMEKAPRVADTTLALVALEAVDLISADDAEVLRSAYRFLRQLELRIRVVRADASHVLEDDARFLRPLARRMNIRDRPDATAGDLLLRRYVEVTRGVRTVYQRVVLGETHDGPPSSIGIPESRG